MNNPEAFFYFVVFHFLKSDLFSCFSYKGDVKCENVPAFTISFKHMILETAFF